MLLAVLVEQAIHEGLGQGQGLFVDLEQVSSDSLRRDVQQARDFAGPPTEEQAAQEDHDPTCERNPP